MTPIKIRTGALLAPIARIARSPRVRCAKAAAGTRSDGINRLIIDGLSKRVRQTKQQPVTADKRFKGPVANSVKPSSVT